MFVYIAVMEGIYNDNFDECGKKTVLWWMHKLMVNTMNKESTLYASAFESYDGSTCRIFSQCMLIYSHVLIFTAMSYIPRNL